MWIVAAFPYRAGRPKSPPPPEEPFDEPAPPSGETYLPEPPASTPINPR